MENDMETDRLCFVFLPYKVSMWDSMETVWKAADKDPDCDAYVVPIPYFDKDQDGNLTVEHYVVLPSRPVRIPENSRTPSAFGRMSFTRIFWPLRAS